MCEYCENSEKISDESFIVSIKNKSLYIKFDGRFERDFSEVHINYCPMCGRKLGEEMDKQEEEIQGLLIEQLLTRHVAEADIYAIGKKVNELVKEVNQLKKARKSNELI